MALRPQASAPHAPLLKTHTPNDQGLSLGGQSAYCTQVNTVQVTGSVKAGVVEGSRRRAWPDLVCGLEALHVQHQALYGTFEALKCCGSDSAMGARSEPPARPALLGTGSLWRSPGLGGGDDEGPRWSWEQGPGWL